MYPARTSSRWLATSASAGSSRRVRRNSLESRRTTGYLSVSGKVRGNSNWSRRTRGNRGTKALGTDPLPARTRKSHVITDGSPWPNPAGHPVMTWLRCPTADLGCEPLGCPQASAPPGTPGETRAHATRLGRTYVTRARKEKSASRYFFEAMCCRGRVLFKVPAGTARRERWRTCPPGGSPRARRWPGPGL